MCLVPYWNDFFGNAFSSNCGHYVNEPQLVKAGCCRNLNGQVQLVIQSCVLVQGGERAFGVPYSGFNLLLIIVTWYVSCTLYHHQQNTLPCWREVVWAESTAEDKSLTKFSTLSPLCTNWESLCCRELLRKPQRWGSVITVRWREEDAPNLPTEKLNSNLSEFIISCLCLWRDAVGN